MDGEYICRRTDGSLLETNSVTFRFRTLMRQAIEDKRRTKYIRNTDRYALLEYSALVKAGNVINGVFDKAGKTPQDVAV